VYGIKSPPQDWLWQSKTDEELGTAAGGCVDDPSSSLSA
jgi:hypothetical protein